MGWGAGSSAEKYGTFGCFLAMPTRVSSSNETIDPGLQVEVSNGTVSVHYN